MDMVCATVYPSLRAASCCRVEVVNGAGGVFFTGRVDMSSMANVAPRHASRKALASCFVLMRRASSRSEEHTSELQSRQYLVCRLLLVNQNTSLSRMPS